jgi:hypothetical protein
MLEVGPVSYTDLDAQEKPEETMMEGPDAGAPMGGGQIPGMNQGQGPKPQAPVPFQ